MLHHMHIYTVHVREGEIDSLDNIRFVREGFNIFAFLFTVFWALYHRCWLLALSLFAANYALVALDQAQYLSEPSIGVIQLGINAVAGLVGNDYVRASLARRGYRLVDVVTGDNRVRAEQRYFDRHLHGPGVLA